MAEVGLRPKVTGMRRAIPAIGPKPGKDADQGSRDGPEEAVEEIGHRGGDPETGSEMLEGFKHESSFRVQASPWAKGFSAIAQKEDKNRRPSPGIAR